VYPASVTARQPVARTGCRGPVETDVFTIAMVESRVDLPLLLLPGVGTDARLFTLQRMEFPQLVVPEWIPPRRGESLDHYAGRLAQAINPRRPCVVGGVSFGGMVALELTRHLPAAGCAVIASVRSASELPLTLRCLGPLAYVLPERTDWLVASCGKLLKHTVGRWLPPRGRMLCDHLSRVRSHLVPWAWRAALQWRPRGDWPCPVYHLHGDADPIFPARRTTPSRIVPGGGHLLPVTHPFVVNEFLRDCLQACRAELEGEVSSCR
jgi:pimeloyl-ACP methyl ester carboxylesterase